MTTLIENIARVAHEVNKAYCESLGDFSHESWEDTNKELKESTMAGVRMHLARPDVTPEQSWELWKQFKLDQGWVWGEKKDFEAKTHPNLVDFYDDLPKMQRAKDAIFAGVVKALTG